MKTDVLIIGSGLAGLNYAVQVGTKCSDKIIVVITKTYPDESNTKYAQGGVAIVQKGTDSFEKHIADTLSAGDGLCDEEIVKSVIEEGPECLNELIRYGAKFDQDASGDFELGREGGHSEKRVVHYQDTTGKMIEEQLIKQAKKLDNVTLLPHYYAVDLITDKSSELIENSTVCHGVFVLNLNENKIEAIYATVTMLATGGIGQVYEHTTNPHVATADGIAMAHRAGADITGMEFIQFHPTALFENASPRFLISEAVRGAGAKLCNSDGKTFMHRYDDREDLAPRDIVSRAIANELETNHLNHIYLDCRSIPEHTLQSHFPSIRQKCLSEGFDITTDLIPVGPVQHYLCGGITSDKWGQTSLNRLFVAGESAQTGLHGANRLASNSLLEAFVFSKRAAERTCELLRQSFDNSNSTWKETGIDAIDNLSVKEIRQQVQQLMSRTVEINRNTANLMSTRISLCKINKEVNELYERSELNIQLCELRNIVVTALLITTASLERKENRGGYFNVDLV